MSAITLDTLSTCIRPCIRAKAGHQLVVADLNAIEVRVLMWLSGCEEGLDVFAKGLCPYKDFATEFYDIPYRDVTKEQRTFCKPPVLGCGYGLGPGQERQLSSGQKEKTGLWKYAESLGVNASQGDCRKMVNLYRSKYVEVTYFWNYLEDAFLAAYKTRQKQQVGFLWFDANEYAVRIQLPSGRHIHYLNPHAWRGSNGINLSFDGLRQGGWGRQSTWGGKLTENVVQAVARDVLAVGLLRAEDAGMPIVGHVHDEGITELRMHSGQGDWWKTRLEEEMSRPIEWAPGLPLKAEGYASEFYMKG